MKRCKIKHLTEQQIITLLASPRAALSRIMVGGGMDEYDLGAMQLSYLLAIQIENESGITCPDTKIIEGFVQQIEAGMEVLEERVEKVRDWLELYAAYLRKVPEPSVAKAVKHLNKLVKG